MERVLDHVAIAVPSIDDVLPQYETLLGARGSLPETVESQGVRIVFIGSGLAKVELLEPLRPDSPVARFLEKRGPGLHHLAYRVPDIDAALSAQIAAGARPIDAVPRRGAHDRRIAFLHPQGFAGVLIELIEVPATG